MEIPNSQLAVRPSGAATLPTVVCPRPNCRHEWTPRVPNPKSCPKCRMYL